MAAASRNFAIIVAFVAVSIAISDWLGAAATTAPVAIDDIPIEGRIIDSDGQPVESAIVTVQSVREAAATVGGIDQPGAADNMLPIIASPIDGKAPGLGQSATTGPDGRFRMTGLGRDRAVELTIRGPGIESDRIFVLTQHVPTETRTVSPAPGAAMAVTLFGSKFEFVAGPGRAISGAVRDAATGKPLAGVRVELMQTFGPQSDSVVPFPIQAITDLQGRYRLDGLPKRRGVVIAAVPIDQPFFVHEIPIEDVAGLADLAADFEMHRGVWVTGRVTDKSTGLPVMAHMQILPFSDNAVARKLPEFHLDLNGMSAAAVPSAGDDLNLTKADGTFRLVAVPGKSVLTATSVAGPYRTAAALLPPTTQPAPLPVTYQPAANADQVNGLATIDVPDDGAAAPANFEFDPGLRLKISIVDEDNQPLTGVLASGLQSARGGGPPQLEATANFDVGGLALDESRTLVLRQDARSLGAIVNLRRGDIKKGRLTIRLDPLCEASGRIIATKGATLAGITMTAQATADSGAQQINEPVAVNADGTFHCKCIGGAEYVLYVNQPGKGLKVAGRVRFTAVAGRSLDLGDLHVEPGK